MPIDSSELVARISRAHELLEENRVDLLLVGPSADFRYLTGKKIGLTERLTSLVMGPSIQRPCVVVPRLTEPILGEFRELADIHTWADGDSPIHAVANIIVRSRATSVAVAEEFWSGHLLELKVNLPEVEFTSAAPLFHSLRLHKSAEELEHLAEASRRHDLVFEAFRANGSILRRTELQIQAEIRELMSLHGLTDIAWIDVGSGPNSASPLHSGGDRQIQAGDPVVLDFAGAWRGYYGDICRTVFAGEPSAQMVDVYEAVAAAQERALRLARPGESCETIDRAAQEVIEQCGYGEAALHRVGHGIGLAAHEHPYIVDGNTELLAVGMTFSLEPGIYIAEQFGVRIEDIIVMEATGARRLNHAAREVVVL